MSRLFCNRICPIIVQITKKNLISLLLVGLVFILAGCKEKSIPYTENPYFIDTSKNSMSEMYTQKSVYDSKLTEYYNETYSYDADAEFKDYQMLPGYEIPIRGQLFEKEDLKINHDVIDLRELFQDSLMSYFLDRDALWYIMYIDLDNCVENIPCYGEEPDNQLHFSMHEDQIYLYYRFTDNIGTYEYIYYYFVDEFDHLNVTLSRKKYNRLNQHLEKFSCVQYIEGSFEKNWSYNSQYEMTIYDFESGEVYRKSMYNDESYTSRFYVPEIATEFIFFMENGTPNWYSNLTQYTHNQIKLSSSFDLRNVEIGMNYIDGWNYVHRLPSDTGFKGILYMDDTPIDDRLVVELDDVTGSLIYITDDSYPYEKVDEDIVSLSRFGLSSGYTYDMIEDLFSDGIIYNQSFQEYYSMDLSIDEVKTLFDALMNQK